MRVLEKICPTHYSQTQHHINYREWGDGNCTVLGYCASQVIVQCKDVMSAEGGVICSPSVYFLRVICDNEEDGADKAAVYRTQGRVIIFIHRRRWKLMDSLKHIDLRAYSCSRHILVI